jgi:hypothetical protein
MWCAPPHPFSTCAPSLWTGTSTSRTHWGNYWIGYHLSKSKPANKDFIWKSGRIIEIGPSEYREGTTHVRHSAAIVCVAQDTRLLDIRLWWRRFGTFCLSPRYFTSSRLRQSSSSVSTVESSGRPASDSQLKRRLSVHHRIHTGNGSQQTSCVMNTGPICTWVMRPESEAGNNLAEVKNARSCAFTPPRILMLWC